MRELIALAVLLASTASSDLEEYRLSVQQQYLDSLYADPWAGASYPAFIECSAGECSCIVAFRGGTSMSCPKKSWSIELEDPFLVGRTDDPLSWLPSLDHASTVEDPDNPGEFLSWGSPGAANHASSR